jgi:hypothetical protein
MPLYQFFICFLCGRSHGWGGLLSSSVALGEMNSKTKKDELGDDAYIYMPQVFLPHN